MRITRDDIFKLHRQLLGNSEGQTLIETVVAIGLLTTGIVGGLALAVYSLSSSDTVLKQVVATGLAREGIEIVRNIRDSNWKSGTLTDCSADMGAGQVCYTTWHNNMPGLPGNNNTRAEFNLSTNSWSMQSSGGPNFQMFPGASGTFLHSGSGSVVYSRRVNLSTDTAAPFSPNNFRIAIESVVWWTGRGCPLTNNPNSTTCKIVVNEYLTNWKNF
jgi:Tfp pilus assembly protein PilV